MRIPAQYVTALTELGYVEREAQFLYLVAVHSGFFVQRQFIEYAGVAGRGPITDFLRKAIQKKHVREHLPERGSQKIYHLFSRRLYAAIEKEHSRNRKTGRYGLLDKASVRLLSLDFVLSHLDHVYLEEETKKVAYFAEERRIATTMLPAKTFHGQQGSETRRCFVERFPIFLSDTADKPIVNFTYLEDELRSLQSFRSFLERYRQLFETLNSNFKLIFVSNSGQSFPDVYAALSGSYTLFLGAHAAVRFGERISRLNLTPPDAGILRMLGASGGLSQQELSTRLSIHPSRLVAILDSLEEKRLVERQANTEVAANMHCI